MGRLRAVSCDTSSQLMKKWQDGPWTAEQKEGLVSRK